MYVRDVLHRKGSAVVTVPPDLTVAGLLATLAEHNIGAVLVTDDAMSVVGVASERDVVRALADRGPGVLPAPVRDIMSTELTVAGPGDGLDQVMAQMTERRVRHIPVLEDGALVGIVSIGDVVKSRMDELESEREQLIGYISSSG
ncbi:CBS domain-containing protein [Motilibacter aurantiacus]|uniref:CBS domain-containing protein n=1 Tax=Motilibacter aurantiacus TaxID=2714955 RepID=UPI00140B9D96|nr:CBS domain-containing protein [Motilibacter aurantiacus]NHC44319.1 CBS domain-containing protein [Motilibacter aurantiacus]